MVSLRAVGKPVWIWVKRDGRTEIEMTLEPGQEAKIAPGKVIWVRAGEPGSLQVTLDGKNIGLFGPKGIPLNREFKAQQN